MITIVSAASPSYLPYMKALVVSARVNFPSAKMVVELVNIGEKYREQFEKNNPNCSVVFTNIKPEDERIYCSNRKCYLMKSERDKGNKDILMWVDADSVIRRSCENIMPIINHDLTVRFKNTTTKIENTVVKELYSGVFAVGNSKAANRILNEYVRMTDKVKYWASCQDNLSYAQHKYGQEDTAILPKELLDFKVGKESLIWTLKCKPKSINGVFHRDRDLYLEMWQK